MPTAREWRQLDAARSDAELIDQAAAFLRDDPRRQGHAGLQDETVARASADLLHILAAGVAGLDGGVRWQTRESCRVLLDRPIASPQIRRTRRR